MTDACRNMIYLTATRFSLSCCACVLCLVWVFFLKKTQERSRARKKKLKSVDDLAKKESCIGFHLTLTSFFKTEKKQKPEKPPRACVCQCARISRDNKAKKTAFCFHNAPIGYRRHLKVSFFFLSSRKVKSERASRKSFPVIKK